jgi:lipid-A-disaccharide synthase
LKKYLKKILISAGEASGDFYGAELAKEIYRQKKGAVKIIGFGGPKMAYAGVDMKLDLVAHAVMGFSEVLSKIFDFMRIFRDVKKIIRAEKPDCLIVIDYPGFHLRLIKEARRLGVKKIIYYITPQVWVWKYNRIYTLKKYADYCVTALPFEKPILEKAGISAGYFGHPVSPYLKRASVKKGPVTVGIFPGSRENEIKSFFEIILKSCALIKMNIKNVSFNLFRSDTIGAAVLAPYLEKYSGLKIKVLKGWDLGSRARLSAAIAKSGTTTLELALMGVPQAVVYRISPVSYAIMKTLSKGRFVSLPNIISGKEIVKEFIQNDFKPERVSAEILRIIRDKRYADAIRKGYGSLKLGNGAKNVTARIAAAVIKRGGI